jgi:hypothetical protein
MNNALISLIEVYQLLDRALIESEGDITEDVNVLLDNFDGDLKTLLDNYRGWINFNESQANMYELEEKRLKARKEACEARIKYARSVIQEAIEIAGETKIKTDNASYSLRQTESWKVKEDVDGITKGVMASQGYAVYKWEPSVSAIKDAVKNGTLPGTPEYINVIRNTSLTIK